MWLFCIPNLATGTCEVHGGLHLGFVMSLDSLLCRCCLVTMCLEQTLISSSSLIDLNLEKTPWALSHGCFCVCLGKTSWCVLGHLRAFQMSQGNPGPPDHRFFGPSSLLGLNEHPQWKPHSCSHHPGTFIAVFF